jgi:undecaprenyl-diphosphatase
MTRGLHPHLLQLVAVVTTAITLALLALAAVDPITGNADEAVARWVADPRATWLEAVVRAPSWIGGRIGLLASGLVAALLLIRERAWVDLGFLVGAFAGSQLVAGALQALFGRSRPDLEPVVALPASASLPSVHAAAGTACVGALAVLATERISSHRWRIAIWSAAVVLGVAVGLSRLVLGVHWLSDVLAGWALGIAWLTLCLLAREAARRRRARPPANRGRPAGRRALHRVLVSIWARAASNERGKSTEK